VDEVVLNFITNRTLGLVSSFYKFDFTRNCNLQHAFMLIVLLVGNHMSLKSCVIPVVKTILK